MKARPLMLVAALAACQPAADTGMPSVEETPSASRAPERGAPPSPLPTAAASSPGRFEPPVLTPEAGRGEKGARNVLLSWAAAMENRDFASARALFRASGTPDRTDYLGYRDITIGFEDGAVEGAAGSLYYAAPVWLTAAGPSGPVRREGTITLRRVNDVPGSTPGQRRWGIERLEQPRDGVVHRDEEGVVAADHVEAEQQPDDEPDDDEHVRGVREHDENLDERVHRRSSDWLVRPPLAEARPVYQRDNTQLTIRAARYPSGAARGSSRERR